jgi:hypothetical protein
MHENLGEPQICPDQNRLGGELTLSTEKGASHGL